MCRAIFNNKNLRGTRDTDLAESGHLRMVHIAKKFL